MIFKMLAPVSAAEVANPARRLWPLNAAGSRFLLGAGLHDQRHVVPAQAPRSYVAAAVHRPQ
jgi:hypothetical protein